ATNWLRIRRCYDSRNVVLEGLNLVSYLKGRHSAPVLQPGVLTECMGAINPGVLLFKKITIPSEN
ncbi:MAG: hypothetical protein ACKN9E_06305, partial [Microcystaceae cyanobacterium]